MISYFSVPWKKSKEDSEITLVKTDEIFFFSVKNIISKKYLHFYTKDWSILVYLTLDLLVENVNIKQKNIFFPSFCCDVC